MNNPFDSTRDAALGQLLREELTPRDVDSFTARILGQLGGRGSSWDVLASWARPGIAASLLLASLLGYWLVVEHRSMSMPTASELLATDQRLDGGVVMDVVLGARR